MEKPAILLNDKYIALPDVKARLWREIMQFESTRKDLKSVDAIDGYCGIIAQAFNITVDDVLDNLNLEDVLPTYLKIFNLVVAMLTAKIGDKKNVTDETTVDF